MDVRPATTGTRGPNRFVTGPLTRFPTTLNNAEGRKTRPACSGGSPRCCCRYRLTTNTVPNQPTMNANPTGSAMRIPRGGTGPAASSGARPALRRARSRPGRRRRRAATRSPRRGEPGVPPSMSPKSSGQSGSRARTCPAQSNGDDGWRMSRPGPAGPASARRPERSHRNPSPVQRGQDPPRTGPARGDRAPTAQTPRALARGGSGNASLTSAIEAGNITAAAPLQLAAHQRPDGRPARTRPMPTPTEPRRAEAGLAHPVRARRQEQKEARTRCSRRRPIVTRRRRQSRGTSG